MKHLQKVGHPWLVVDDVTRNGSNRHWLAHYGFLLSYLGCDLGRSYDFRNGFPLNLGEQTLNLAWADMDKRRTTREKTVKIEFIPTQVCS